MNLPDDRDLKRALDALDAHQMPPGEQDWDERVLRSLAAGTGQEERRPSGGNRRRPGRLRLLLAACLALAALLLFMSSGAGARLGLPDPIGMLVDRDGPPRERPAVALAPASPSTSPSHSPKPSHSASPSLSPSPTPTKVASTHMPTPVSTPLVSVTPPPSWPQDPSTNGSQHWSRQRSGTRDDLAAVDFEGGSGWAVGAGVVLASADGGSSWAVQSTGYEGWLFGVDFTSAFHGWAVGGAYDGVVLGTADGGETWERQAGVDGSLRAVCAAGSERAWAAGALDGRGRVLGTSDGGTTWTEQPVPACSALNDVSFADADHGWAVGYDGAIIATVDGGQTWTVQPSRTGADLSSVSFLDASHGWAAGTAGSGLYRARAVLLSTSDGGATWRRITLGDRGTAFDEVTFTDQQHGYATARYRRDALCLVTEDGGRTWLTQAAVRHGRLQGIAALASGQRCAVGARGSVFLSAAAD